MIGADDGIKESSFESEFKLFYNSIFSEGEVAEVRKLLELSNVLIEAFSLFETLQFPLCIFNCVGVGEGSAEFCFKELPVAFIGVRSSSGDTVNELS